MAAPRVWMDWTIDGQPAGRTVFEMNTGVPKTCENFMSLCTNGTSANREPVPYDDYPSGFAWYKGIEVQRNIPAFMCQVGAGKSGRGGITCWGTDRFDDESFVGEAGVVRKHELAMANRGPNTASCQFFITYKDAPHLNGKHVKFARVVEGFDVLDKMEQCGASDRSGKPIKKLVVADAGIVQ